MAFAASSTKRQLPLLYRAVKRSSLILLVLAVAVVGGAAAFALLGSSRTLPESLLSMVPRDTPALLHVRVNRVLKSKAFERLVVERGQAKGMQRIEEKCGFNPLSKVDELLVYMVERKAIVPDAGLIARGGMDPRKLGECIKKATGTQDRKLNYREVDGFHEVCSSNGHTCINFAGRDGMFGGSAGNVAKMREVLAKKKPSAEDNAALLALYRTVAQADIGLAAIVPESVRDTLGPVLARRVPLARPLLKAQTIAASANLGDDIAGELRLGMVDEAAAQTLVTLVQAQLQRLLQIPGVSVTPLAKLIKVATVRADGATATFSGVMPVAQAATLLDLAPAAQALFAPGSAAPTSAPTPAPTADAPQAPSTSTSTDAHGNSEPDGTAQP